MAVRSPERVDAPARMRVVDADTHFWQPLELWEDYIEPAFKQQIIDLKPRATKLDVETMKRLADEKPPAEDGAPKSFVGGHLGGYKNTLAALSVRGADHADARIEWMDGEGIEACIIYAGATALAYTPDSAIAAAACRALNRWAADFASYAPNRLKPCLILPWHDPARAIEELDGALKQGFEVAFATPTPSTAHRWSDRAYDKLWARMEEAGVVMTFHEFTKLPGTANNIVRTSYSDVHAMMYLCGHTVEAQLTLMDLMYGGVFSRFPKLRIGIVEAHTAWLPGWLAMLTQQWSRAKSSFDDSDRWGDPNLTPLDLFRRQGFIVSLPDDLWVDQTIAEIGVDNILISSDYPHPQTKYGLRQRFETSLGHLGEEAQRKILGENAARIFKLPAR